MRSCLRFPIYPLLSRRGIQDAGALLTLVFGGVPRIRRTHRLYGIYAGWPTVMAAVTAVNLADLALWWRRRGFDASLQTPQAAEAFLAVHPDFRRRGYARALREYIQRPYLRLVTGTGPKSDLEAMFHLNEQTGFKLIWRRGSQTTWYWSRT